MLAGTGIDYPLMDTGVTIAIECHPFDCRQHDFVPIHLLLSKLHMLLFMLLFMFIGGVLPALNEELQLAANGPD